MKLRYKDTNKWNQTTNNKTINYIQDAFFKLFFSIFKTIIKLIGITSLFFSTVSFFDYH